MKRNCFTVILILAFCFFCPYGYSDNASQELHNSSSNESHSTSNRSNIPENSTIPQTKPSKNYFDIKPDEKEGDRFFSEFMNMLTTLGLIVAIILLATWFLKRMVNSKIQQLNTTSLIKIVEQRTLSPKTSLYFLDIQGKGFILAESINGVTSLGSFDVSEIEKAPPTNFKDIMKNRPE